MPPSPDIRAAGAGHADGGSPTCDMCSHADEYHDSIATRYCAATASSALSRGCVCRLPVPVG